MELSVLSAETTPKYEKHSFVQTNVRKCVSQALYTTSRENEPRERVPVPHDNYLTYV